MTDTHVIEYEVSEDMADAAADAILKSLGTPPTALNPRRLMAQMAVYATAAVLLAGVGAWLQQPWWFFMLPCALLGLAGIVVGLSAMVAGLSPGVRRQIHNGLAAAFRRLQSPHVRWTVDSATITVQSGRGVREIRWSDVKDVFLDRDFWVMRVNGHPTMLLRADAIRNETARFLLTQARGHGASIRMPTADGGGDTSE
ncbi:MAG TPA: hypothetical protein VKE40_18555 [Gemmataceae bacterium]|nr:hypothetical protein [Gemmataceae bacterium]